MVTDHQEGLSVGNEASSSSSSSSPAESVSTAAEAEAAAVVSSKSVRVLRIAVGSSNPAKIRAVEHALQRAVDRRRRRRKQQQELRPIADDNDDDDIDDAPAVTLDIQGWNVPSGVPDQPWGNDETKRGAQNRARAAYQEYRLNHHNRAAPHLAIGLEGGLECLNNNDSSDDSTSCNCNHNNNNNKDMLFCMAWMAVYGKRDAVSVECLASADTTSYAGDRRPVFGLAKTALFPIPDAVTTLVKQGVELGDADDQVFCRVQSKHGDGVVGILSDGLIDRSDYYEHAITLALLPWIRPDLYPDGN